jgi:site-specific DNA-methyltransferase (adenine-specific)
MHDGSDVIVNQFPNAKGAVSNGDATVGETSNGVINPMRRGNLTSYGDDGSAARFFYCPKTSKSERHNGLEKNTHPTVKPIELMKYLCRLVTPKGGTVLDPFMGSGSTGMAAKDEGFDFIGIEKEEEYFKICESRIKSTSPLMDFM